MLHAGGLGDLVLSTPLLAAIAKTGTDRRITFCCRAAYAPLAACWPFRFDRIVEIEFDPYVVPPRRTDARSERFFSTIGSEAFDGFVSVELAPTWLTPLVASILRPTYSLARSYVAIPPALLTAAHGALDIEPFHYRTYPWPDNQPESNRYKAFAEMLGLEAAARPALSLPASAEREADAFFDSHEPSDRKRLACFPLGNRSVPQKRWPLDRHVATIAALAKDYELRPLLIGDAGERSELDAVKAQLHGAGVPAEVLAGEIEQLPFVAAVLARCAGFIGNDTGLAHVAAALGTPGVTLYGGGTWPSFEPWAPGTVGVVNPLPCFGCGWDCAFEKVLCLDDVRVEDALEGFTRALSRGPNPEVVSLDRRSTQERETIALASATHRSTQTDRLRRFEVIVDLEQSLSESQRIAQLRRELLMDAERDRTKMEEDRATTIAALESEIERLHERLGERGDEQ